MSEDEETAKYFEDNTRKQVLKEFGEMMADDYESPFAPPKQKAATWGEILDLYKSGDTQELIRRLGGF